MGEPAADQLGDFLLRRRKAAGPGDSPPIRATSVPVFSADGAAPRRSGGTTPAACLGW